MRCTKKTITTNFGGFSIIFVLLPSIRNQSSVKRRGGFLQKALESRSLFRWIPYGNLVLDVVSVSVHRSIRWYVPVFYGTFPLGIAAYDQAQSWCHPYRSCLSLLHWSIKQGRSFLEASKTFERVVPSGLFTSWSPEKSRSYSKTLFYNLAWQITNLEWDRTALYHPTSRVSTWMND